MLAAALLVGDEPEPIRRDRYDMNDDAEAGRAGMRTRAPSAAAVAFDGRRGELATLLVRNLLLNLATLGIYRFWAKTRVRGFMWRHVKLLGEPLEYLGTGNELLVGFLIALVILAPLTSVWSFLPLILPEGMPYQGLALQGLYYTLLGFLIQVAVHRVRRYRLTRTAWHGVRFGLDGSSLVYASIWFLYGAVTLATLGLAYPWMRVATTRYFARHARFGSTAVSFDARARRLFPLWLVVITPALAAAFLFVVMNWEAFAVVGAAWNDYVAKLDRALLDELRRSLAELDYRPGWLLVLSLILLTWYRVNQFRYLLGAARVGEVRLDSRLGTGAVYVRQAVFYLCIAGALVFFWVTAMTTATMIVRRTGSTDTTWILLLFGGLTGLVYFLYGFTRKLFLELSLLKLACTTLLLHQPEALERTAQSSAALPGHGEGLADALDVGGF